MAQKPTFAEWVERKPGKKPRKIQDPRGDTEKVHYRIYELLDRVLRPDFLHSATRRRSIVTNAERHIGIDPIVATDMKSCYESTTIHHVAHFFQRDLCIASDLAWKLARICTIHGHLPTGSCLSPLLAYWVHRAAFDQIDSLCMSVGVRMTVYVDDLTLSGKKASVTLLYQCKAILARAGLETHKDRSFPVGSVKIITGVAVSAKGLCVPNKRLQGIMAKMDLLHGAKSDELGSIKKSLAGSIASANAISRRTGAALRNRHIRMERALNILNPCK